MTKFRFTYKNIENAFEAEFAKFIGTTENELWKHKAFVQWYNETAEEL